MDAATKRTKGREARRKSASLKGERLSMRIDSRAKARLERAATYTQKSVSDYVVSSALLAAEADIARHEEIILDAPAWDVFFKALHNPPTANRKLNALLTEHDETVVSL